jgi:hypothetical protein
VDYDRHLLGIHTLLALLRGVSRRKQQNIPLAERDVQCVGDDRKKIPAGSAPSAFHKAQMTLRNVGIHREVELAFAALLSPVAQQFAELRNCGSQKCITIEILLLSGTGYEEAA